MNETVAPQVQSTPEYFAAADIARALSTPEKTVHSKTVKYHARREKWPAKFDGYRRLFAPPEHIAQVVIAAPREEKSFTAPLVRFSDLAHSDAAREMVLLRERAVQTFRAQKYLGIEVALQSVSAIMRATYPGFRCRTSALRKWDRNFAAHGLDGLVEQKRGRSGRPAFVKDLSDSEKLLAASIATGKGQWRKNNPTTRLNIARAFREMVANPTIGGDARRWLHDARASKSSCPPSFKKMIRQMVDPLTATMLQKGRKALKLEGPWINRDYSGGSANHVITADDMTANCYVWTEWSNERGFILIRPQILAVLHVGSLCWLNERAIVNARKLADGTTTGSSTYSTLDSWATLGDTLDTYGVFVDENNEPEMTFLLEGGAWQGNDIVGHRVMPSDKQRFGGLRSLGKNVKIQHAHGPRAKGMIEGAFHQLQTASDDVPGYCGRDERKDCPEITREHLRLCGFGTKGIPHAHPRQFFMHITDYRKHVEGVMSDLNLERNDGKICGGMSPIEKLKSLNLRTSIFPDRLKYMYRSSYGTSKVTENGWGVSRTVCGRTERFQYDNPKLRMIGSTVAGFWDENNPDSSAVIFSIKNGLPHEQICVAERVSNPPAFGATPEEFKAAATCKNLKISLVLSQAKKIAPLIQRNVQIPNAHAAEVGDQIHAARVEQGKRIRSQKTLRDFQGGAEALLDNQFADTETNRSVTLPSIDEIEESSEGPDRDGNKPLMKNQPRLDERSPIGITDGNTFSETDLSASALLD